jgi:hypothetical protein
MNEGRIRKFKVAKCDLKARGSHKIPTVCIHRTWRINVGQCFEKWQGDRNEYKNY